MERLFRQGNVGRYYAPARTASSTTMSDSAAIFTDIYQTNAWQNAESRSGPGSTVARCQPVIRALRELVEFFAVKTLLDAPCGDFNWMKEVPLEDVRYIGIDVVPEFIEGNRVLHGSSRREFHCRDFTCGPLPRADMIFCRDGLVHLSFADVLKALSTFQHSRARYLVATTFPAQSVNEDIATGGWRPLNLQRAPFHLPPPVRLVSDGCPIPEYADKALGVWRLGHL
jgi:hypothetical protein